MDKKRILVYTESYLPAVGGLENNTLLLCETLTTLNCQITLLTPQSNATPHPDFTVIENKFFYNYPSIIRKNDMIIVNGGVSFKMIIPTLLAFKPFVIIYQMATLFNDIRNRSLKTLFLNKLRKNLAFLAKKNIAVSEFSFKDLEKVFGQHKVSLLINPANPVFTPTRDSIDKVFSRPFNCLFAGRLILGKGIKLIIDAIHEINKNEELIHLYIVGDGPEKEFVVSESKKNYIHYYPPVNKERLKKWLQKIHLTVIPSTSHIEGSPLIMAESLMMEKPVLVSSQPAMVSSINHQALVFETGNMGDLIEKLNFITIENNYSIVKTHCQKISFLYSYNNYVKSLKTLLNV